MNRVLKFRRKLSAAGIVVVAILFLAFFVAFRSASREAGMNQWVTHTQEVLGVIARAKIERSSMQNEIWAYHLMHTASTQETFRDEAQGLQNDVGHLRVLTVDNPTQQEAITELSPIVEQQIVLLGGAMEQAKFSTSHENFNWSLPSPSSERMRQLLDSLEANEHRLLAARTENARLNGRNTRIVLAAAAILTFITLTAAGTLIDREMTMRAQVETGLRHAQELLGVKFEEQRFELGQTLQDLHAQIRARQNAEDSIRELNEDLEKRVRQRTGELEEMNRELEAFSYSVSHDLRSPLRHMDGFSRILQQEYGKNFPEAAQHYLSRIRNAATHMSELVEDLLHFSHIGRQPLEKTECSMTALVGSVQTDAIQEYADRKIEWNVSALPEVRGDRVLLKQVFANLISNAVKFTRQQAVATIEIGSYQDGDKAVVFVRDNGAGFDPQYADKLFGVFQRLHRQDEFEGTGIGLATVQRIIHKHEGRVWAESQPGQGATFYFSLPKTTGTRAEEMQMTGATA
jgi:signal transduction histidine kinase